MNYLKKFNEINEDEQPRVMEADNDTINSFVHWVDDNDGIIGKDQIVDKYGEYMKYVSRLNKAKISYRQLSPSDIIAIERELEKRGMISEDTQNEKFVPSGFAYTAKYRIAWNDALDRVSTEIKKLEDHGHIGLTPESLDNLINGLRDKYADDSRKKNRTYPQPHPGEED